jgi:hypothetical protein
VLIQINDIATFGVNKTSDGAYDSGTVRTMYKDGGFQLSWFWLLKVCYSTLKRVDFLSFIKAVNILKIFVLSLFKPYGKTKNFIKI